MKNAIVTGSSKGLGRVISEVLAAEGYRVWMTARSTSELEKAKAEIEQKTGGSVLVHSLDFMNTEAVKTYADALLKTCETVDIIVNNAGMFIPDQLDEHPTKLDQHMKMNFEAAYTITQQLLPKMVKAQKGHIFNVCSVVNRNPRVGAASYTISKFALWGYHQLLYKTMLPHGVKVCAFFPSSINTSSWAGADVPFDDFVQPEDIASLIVTILKMKRGTVPSEIDLGSINPKF